MKRSPRMRVASIEVVCEHPECAYRALLHDDDAQGFLKAVHAGHNWRCPVCAGKVKT